MKGLTNASSSPDGTPGCLEIVLTYSNLELTHALVKLLSNVGINLNENAQGSTVLLA